MHKTIYRILLQFVVLAICFYGLNKIRSDGITPLSASYVILSAVNISSSYFVLINAGRLFYYTLIFSLSISILYPTYIVIAAIINLFMFSEPFWIVFFVCLGGIWVIIQLIREPKARKSIIQMDSINHHDIVNIFYIVTAIPAASFIDVSNIDGNVTLLGAYAVAKWFVILSILLIWIRNVSIFISALIFIWVSFYLLFYAYLGIFNEGTDILIVLIIHAIYILLFMMTFFHYVYKRKKYVKNVTPA